MNDMLPSNTATKATTTIMTTTEKGDRTRWSRRRDHTHSQPRRYFLRPYDDLPIDLSA